MSNGFPCPSPGCGHVFTRAEVFGAESVRCPDCGQAFRLRAQKGRRKNAAPGAPPDGLAPAAAAPEAAVAIDPLASIDVGEEVLPPGRRRRRDPFRTLIIGAMWVVAIILAVVAYPRLVAMLRHRPAAGEPSKDDGGHERGYHSRALNWSLATPPREWKQDVDLLARLGANVVLRRSGPAAYLAIAARTFKSDPLGEAEVMDEAAERLGHCLLDLESESRGKAEWAGRVGQRFVFQGKMEGEPVSGECYVLADGQVGYWLAAWAPADVVDQVAGEFEELRQGFTLGNERPVARDKGQVFQGGSGPYKFREPEGSWHRLPRPADEGSDVDLVLQGADRDAPKDVNRMASIIVRKVKKREDSAAVLGSAVEDLTRRQQKDDPEARIEVMREARGSAALSPGVRWAGGQVVKLRITRGIGGERFVLLGVIPRGDGVLVVRCECALDRRGAWEHDFQKFLEGTAP